MCIRDRRCLNHGAAVVGIRHGRGLEVGHGREQDGILIPAFVLGCTNDPLTRGPAEPMGAQDGRHLPARTGGGLPRPNGLTQLVHPPTVTDFSDDLIAPTSHPVEHLGRAKASVHAQDNLRPPLTRPTPVGFHLLERRFQRRDGGRFAPQQGFMEYCSVSTCRDP